MIYVINRTMFAEFGGNREAIIEYINETFMLKSEVTGIAVR